MIPFINNPTRVTRKRLQQSVKFLHIILKMLNLKPQFLKLTYQTIFQYALQYFGRQLLKVNTFMYIRR